MAAEELAQDKDVSDTSTPSPSVSMANTSSSSASRRPPRKSTLTQQQKNQKRQRATQDQLSLLEVEFTKNPTPTAAVRERIAQEINMTERSVQIWFQNSRRRAKIKMIAKKTIETGEDCDSIPESYRQYLAMQAYDSGKPLGRSLTQPGGPMAQYGSGGMLLNSDPNASGKVVIHHFSCRSLSIGSWRRVGQNAMDLVIFYSPDKACITYYINNDSAGYKIEFPFAYIKNITLESGEPSHNNGAPPRPAGLVIELNRPPNFFMDSSGSGGFYQCGDFTEDQQASQIMTHHLGGHPKVLSGQLAKLVSLESFQNRHSPFDINAMPASAPVSPTLGIARPASQPNAHFSRPHPHVGMFQEGYVGMGLQPGRGPGHKRQRSRSVPVAIDFSLLHQPMPSFHIQQPSAQFTPDHHLYAPIPQPPGQGPLGPNLRIDTSSGYGLDYRQYPVSATATSPSEFASPGFFHPPPPQPQPQTENAIPAAQFATPYSLPFLSPSPMMDPAQMIPPSVSPLSHMSHHDPIIADQSPPLSGIHRSASADMFAMQDHPTNLSDDGLMLSEMYSKQNLNMPTPSPGFDNANLLQMQEMGDFNVPAEYHTPQEVMDEHMMPFGTVDPNSLKADQPHP